MSSSNVLRKAVVHEAPAVIDNSFELDYMVAAMQPPESLVEELQYENPDADPEEIEDAISEAMDQLRDLGPESAVAAPELDAVGEDDGSATLDLPDFGDFFAGVAPGSLDAGFDDATILAPAAIVADAAPPQADVVDQARREAERVLAEADDRAAEIERAAYQKGYEEGLAGGRANGEEQAAEMVKQVVAIVEQATELHDTMLREAETEMVALCLEIARKVVQAELRTNPDVVHGVVSAAVQKINGSPRVTIKVNPGQVESVKKHWASAFGPNYREKEWVIEGDPQVPAGGCILDTKYGSIDARIGTQFDQIQKTLELLLGTE